MQDKLDDLLCQRYPALLVQRRLPESESCMGRGFVCGDGWFELIDTLCETIQFWVDLGNMPPVTVVQVKEKIGTLRFRYRGGDERTNGMVSMAEAFSARICETCGVPGHTQANHAGLSI